MMKKLFFIQASLALALLCTPAHAIVGLNDTDAPVTVNADDMIYEMDKNTVTFVGNVNVQRGGFTMTADKMTIHMLEEEQSINIPPKETPLTGQREESPQVSATDSSKLERIDAVGNVKFDYDTQSGSSESATYNAKDALLTMRGNPVVRDGENFIRGHIIRYYMNEQRSEVVSEGKKRVEAVFGTTKK